MLYYMIILTIIQAGGLALLAPPAACDSDIFHYTTENVIYNMHAIQALIVNIV